jgi:glycerophosphoryl diester phosphodiesterase
MEYAFLDHPGPIPFAHRGGALEGLENTLPAFEAATKLGYRYLETDCRVTADGVLLAFHDDDLSRTCDRPGKISELPWSEVQNVRVGGREPIPLLEDLLGHFPTARFNLDAKSDATVMPMIETIRRTGSIDRVCIGSFTDGRLKQIRAALGPRLCTSMGPIEVCRWLAGSLLPGGLGIPRVPIAQVPVKKDGVPVVTARSVRAADRKGIKVQVWTIDDPAEMDRLLDLGVQGLITDRPQTLKEVLQRRGQWFP